MTSDYYDPDDLDRSPPMKAVKINYGLDEPRPPFVPEGESPKCDDDKGTDQRSHHRPDVAEEAAKHPLQELKRSRVVDSDQNRGKCPPLASIKPPEAIKDPVMDFSTPTAISPRTVDTPFPKPQSPEGKTPLPPILPLNSSRDSPPQRRRFPSLTSSLPNILPPHQRRASSDRSVPNPPAQLKQRLSVPSLQPLPSIQSPPSSSAATSPETASNTPLPSISALGLNKSDVAPNANPFGFSQVHYGPPGIATPRESPLDRQLPSLLPPSPYNHFSPVSAISAKDVSNNPSPASQAPTWRTPTSTTTPAGLPPPPPPPPPLPPAPSEHTIPQSPYEMSPMTAKSPATSYPTPTEQIGPTVGGQSTFSANMVHNGVATGAGHYQCDHPGCTAPPFQTQYLLNSHANVHSQDRPHFCPVDGCPRGLGGKGFKRKNEMMRHGLVHNSPGYVCPFCPDQQHKYPRPDNLQRHVRVHHVDKSKDDPTLRQVLAQRPIGSTRGRRRRINA